MSQFCEINNDDKTKRYIAETINFLKDGTKPILALDNEIQRREIETHLFRCNTSDRDNEACQWIILNATKFRTFLNTVKLTAFILMCSGKDIESISDEEYRDLQVKINSSDQLLDYIFLN